LIASPRWAHIKAAVKSCSPALSAASPAIAASLSVLLIASDRSSAAVAFG